MENDKHILAVSISCPDVYSIELYNKRYTIAEIFVHETILCKSICKRQAYTASVRGRSSLEVLENRFFCFIYIITILEYVTSYDYLKFEMF